VRFGKRRVVRNQLLIDRGKLFVGGLEFFFRCFQFFVQALQFFVCRDRFCVRILTLFLRGLMFLDDLQEPLPRICKVLLQDCYLAVPVIETRVPFDAGFAWCGFE
jgi:hypothetical protein